MGIVKTLTRKATNLIPVVIAVGVLLSGCKRNGSFSSDRPGQPVVEDAVYLAAGQRLTAQTFDTLRKSLTAAIASSTPAEAVTFCNTHAYAITNTYADSVAIRRTATRYRNPANKPDSIEQVALRIFESAIDKGEATDELLLRDNGGRTVHYFRAITMKPMCLSCHGQPVAEVQRATLERIQQTYPGDRAVGFRDGDLRGLWHVRFGRRAD